MNRLQPIVMLALLFAGAPAFAADHETAADKTPGAKGTAPEAGPFVPARIPLFSERFADFPVAMVEDDPITLKDLSKALAGAHEERSEGKGVGKVNYRDMLDRLVTVKLIEHEARNMGLDELPEVKQTVESYSKNILTDEVIDRATKAVKTDETEAEKFYRELVREYRIRSVLFEKEDAAKKALEDIRTGKDFGETAKKLVESHEAKSSEEEKFARREGLLPEIAQAVTDLKAGQVSPVVRIEAGYVILKLEETRIPQAEDSAAREQARELARKTERSKVLTEYKKSLVKKYVTVHVQLVNKLDFEATTPGFDKLTADKRVVAEIKGEKPLTVGEFAKAVRAKLYHGVEAARENKTINEKKLPVLDELISRRILLKEARRMGLDKTAEYKDNVKDFEVSTLFDQFVQKAIIPDVKPTAEDLKAYFESHRKDYTSPRMVKLRSIALSDKKRAEAAIDQLRKGTDFNWLKENADGVVKDAGDLVTPGVPVIVRTLPEELQKALEGASPGQVKLYPESDTRYDVVLVTEVIPEKQQPFEDVREKIRNQVVRIQLDKALDAWNAKLRAAYSVTIYLTENGK